MQQILPDNFWEVLKSCFVKTINLSLQTIVNVCISVAQIIYTFDKYEQAGFPQTNPCQQAQV